MAVFNNNNRITFGCFLAYFVMSAVISPLGMVSAPIAEQFDVSLPAANAVFTFLTTGVFIGTLIAVFIFDYVQLKRVIIGGAVAICLSIFLIYALDSFLVLKLSLGLIGISCGVELSAAAVVISKIYEEKLRASMLLLTDSFYSIAGVLSTMIAGVFLADQMHWSSAYLLAFVVTFLIAGIALFSRYPATERAAATGFADAVNAGNWPMSVHAVGFSMLLYLVGFVTIYSWVPNYAQSALAATVDESGTVVSRLFLGMFIGQLVMFFLVLKFSLRTLILVYATLATALTFSLWSVPNASQLQLSMLILGLVTGGLFKTLLTYGTTAVKSPSPKMVSYLIFHAGLGTAVAPFVSSMVVDGFSMRVVLQFATLCYLAMLVLIGLACWLRSR